MHILALDVGTSSVKAAIMDVARAETVGPIARVTYELDQPTPDAATIPPERLWAAVTQAARQATSSGPVEGIGLSCLSPALILLDENDKPLTPVITHLDRESRSVAREVWSDVGPEFLASTGNKPLPGGITAICYRHLTRQNPDLATRVKRYLHANSWLGLRLTGKAAFDRGNASFTGLFDTMTTQEWSPRWCEYFGVQAEWLPPVVSGDTTIGTLTREAAELVGASPGIPVKLGTADTSCAMLAAGMGPGDLLHVVGTTQVLAAYAKKPQPAENRLTRLHGVGDAFIYVVHNPVGGVALDWIHRLCFSEQSEQRFYEHTIPAAMQRTPSVVLDPPFLGGDRLEIEPRRAGFRELVLATEREDLLAAILNAMRTHHQHALAALGTEAGSGRVFLTGGGARVIKVLIPEYSRHQVISLDEASLRGVARLFGKSG